MTRGDRVWMVQYPAWILCIVVLIGIIPAVSALTYEYQAEWPLGTRPYGIAVDDITRNVLVGVRDSDDTNHLRVYNLDGSFKLQWAYNFDGDGHYHQIRDIAVRPGSWAFVAHSAIENGPKVCDQNGGGCVCDVGAGGGTPPPYWMQPCGIAVTPDMLYATDYYGGYSIVQRYTSLCGGAGYQGSFSNYGDGEGQLHGAHGIAVNSSGYVFVASYENPRIEVFNATGSFLYQWSLASGTYPNDIAVDAFDNLLVVERGGNQTEVFSPAGTLLATIGGPGIGPGEFDNPCGIAVNTTGYVFITDFNNNRIQVFRTHGPIPYINNLTPSSTGAGGPSFTLTITGSNFTKASLVTWNGTSRPTTFNSPTNLTVTIDGTEIATAGSYPVQVLGPYGNVSNIVHFNVIAPPVASFTAVPTTGTSPLTVQFNDTSTGGILTAWNWSFGDGSWFNTTQACLRNTTYIYSINGTYHTTLTVSNAGSSNTSLATTITVNPPLPVIDFEGVPRNGSAPLTVGFTERCTGVRTMWNWSFGDGTPNGTEIHPTHVFSYPGIYTITLTAGNPGGSNTSVKAAYITVSYSGAGPAISSSTPASGLLNTTIAFSVSGNNFRNGSVVNFTNSTYGNVTTTLGSVAMTKITGTVFFPPGAPAGKWNITVTVPDGRSATKIGAFTVNKWAKPTISSVAPTSGYRNATTTVTITGTNFQAGAIVNFTNSTFTGGNLTLVTSSITSTKITGNLTVPPGAPTGKWNVVVTTPDGGQSLPKTGAFTVNAWKKPTVSSITPTSGYPNITIPFTLSGANFQQGAVVTFFNNTYGNVIVAPDSVTLTKVTGSVLFPPGAPTGKWDLTVTTPDGGQSTPKTGAFTVNPWKAPTISSIVPTSGFKNTTVTFTLSGTNFQPYSVVKFKYSAYGTITTTPWSISPTKINGFFAIPSLALAGKYDVEVIEPDGKNVTKTGIFTVKDWSTPTITSISPVSGVHGTTVGFTLSGTNFQPGSQVTFTNATVPAHNITATTGSVAVNKIYGSVYIPADRSGKFGIQVLCPDGKVASKANIFTVT